jgi:hypothetical protein
MCRPAARAYAGLTLSNFNAGLTRRCLIAWRDERQMGVRFLNA